MYIFTEWIAEACHSDCKESHVSGSVVLEIINRGVVVRILTLVSAHGHTRIIIATPEEWLLSPMAPTHILLLLPLMCSALQEAAHDYLNTSLSLFLVI